MNILTGILQAATPVIANASKDVIATVFSENVARDRITRIANTVIDTACTIGMSVLANYGNEESSAKAEPPHIPHSNHTPITMHTVPIYRTSMRQDIMNTEYDKYFGI